jgi:hypothetical protein
MNLRAVAVTTVSLLAVFSAAALAGPRDDVLDAMGKCATLADDKARLECYDGLAPRLRDALNVPPETLSHPPTKEEQQSWFGFNLDHLFGSGRAPATQTTPEPFGADKLAAAPATAAAGTAAAPAEPEEIDSITAGVTDYSVNPFGKFIVFLDNGQVWRQIDSDVAHFSRSSPNSVAIDRGSMGSYNMRINDGNHIYKVTRVK